MNDVTSNWIQLENDFYDKVELYSGGVFANIDDTCRLVSGPNAGLVLVTDKLRVRVLTGSGEQLAAWKWNNPPQVCMGWSSDKEPVFILEDGTVLVYSLFGTFKSSFSMGQEAKDMKILAARIFSSSSGSTGVAVLTSTFRFYMVSSLQEHKVRKLDDVEDLKHFTSWCPLTHDRQNRLLLGRGTDLVLLSHNDKTVLNMQIGGGIGTESNIIKVCLSPSQSNVAVVTDTGLLWIGTFTRKLSDYQLDSEVMHMAWCGEEVVFLSLTSGLSNLVHVSGAVEVLYGISPIGITQECDGVRIISPGFHDLIHRVTEPVQDIFKIGSMSPGSILLMASQAYNEKSHKADDYIRMIGARLDQAVSQCISAAGALFQPAHQKQLMRAAKFGNSFLQGFASDDFYHQCQTLKILNAVRHYKIGMPLTCKQLVYLSKPVLIDRLIARRLFPMAIAICEYLKLPQVEGKSRVLGHWACYKVETSTADEDETARQVSNRLGLNAEISYSDVASKAAQVGKKRLAVKLLEHEVRADKQVPLLLKLGQGAKALSKAIDSGDTDLIYHVILNLQEAHSTADFHMIMRGVKLGASLYAKYCAHYNTGGLQSWLQQEDDWLALAAHTVKESYASGRIETRLSHMVTAQEYYRKAKHDFNLTAIEESSKLLNHQSKLEEKFGRVYLNKSLHATVSQLLEEGEFKLADKLRSEFKVSDRKYLWLKVRAFGKSKQWVELANLAKNKKSIIGFGPFVDVCIEAGCKDEANRYLVLLNNEDRLKYLMKLEIYSEAAELAYNLKNVDALTMIEVKSVNNFSMLEKVAGLKQRLQSSR
uniref:Vacuolar protein sorting-associated protein 16 homolog n=1 Tax=Acartia pacifica TaxID=335913 RepID=A0A0U2T402_ACAPC|nr:vacuolar protein sorting-associated protein 16-like protein [Acartia pacifica]